MALLLSFLEETLNKVIGLCKEPEVFSFHHRTWHDNPIFADVDT